MANDTIRANTLKPFIGRDHRRIRLRSLQRAGIDLRLRHIHALSRLCYFPLDRQHKPPGHTLRLI